MSFNIPGQLHTWSRNATSCKMGECLQDMQAAEPVLACFLEARLSTLHAYNLYCSRNWKLYNAVHNGKHSKVHPPSRKATLELINFSRSNRHIWLPGIVDEHCDIHSWTLLCCLKYHHIVMSISSSRECVMLPRPFLKLLGVSNECQCWISDGDGF